MQQNNTELVIVFAGDNDITNKKHELKHSGNDLKHLYNDEASAFNALAQKYCKKQGARHPLQFMTCSLAVSYDSRPIYHLRTDGIHPRPDILDYDKILLITLRQAIRDYLKQK